MKRINPLPIYCLNFLSLYWFYDFVYVEFITNCYEEALIILVLFSFYILSNSTFLDMVMSFHLLSTTYTFVYFPTSTNKKIKLWQFLTNLYKENFEFAPFRLNFFVRNFKNSILSSVCWLYIISLWSPSFIQVFRPVQLFSKCLFGVFNCFKKQTKTIRLEIP